MSDNNCVTGVLCVGLCIHIETPTVVTFRREVMDIQEMIRRPYEMHEGHRKIYSGSDREGFRSNSSDRDVMFCMVYRS